MPSAEHPSPRHVAVTGRLVLREADPVADAGFMFRLMNDPEWLSNIGDRGIRTERNAETYLDGYRAGYAANGFGMYVVVERESGTPAGVCGLLKRPWMDDVEIGFAFLPGFRRRGYGAESAGAVLGMAHPEFGLERVAAITVPGNGPSIALLERLGMRREGSVRSPETQTWLLLYRMELPRRSTDAPTYP